MDGITYLLKEAGEEATSWSTREEEEEDGVGEADPSTLVSLKRAVTWVGGWVGGWTIRSFMYDLRKGVGGRDR